MNNALDNFEREVEAEETWLQCTKSLADYLVEHPSDFRYQIVRGFLRIAAASLKEMRQTQATKLRRRKILGTQIWLSRHSREKSINKICMILPEDHANRILAVDVSAIDYISAMTHPPTQTIAQRELEVHLQEHDCLLFDNTRVSMNSPSPTHSEDSDLSSLTPSEERVLALVHESMTG